MPKITEIYAWIADEGNGDEGIPAVSMVGPLGPMMMPLLGADKERIESLKPTAEMARNFTSLRFKKFVLLEEENEKLH